MSDEENLLPENLPLFQKGEEIIDVVHRICELIPEDNDMLMEVRSMMMFDAAQLTIKVAGAEAGELYDLKMEAATIIRKSAIAIHALVTLKQLLTSQLLEQVQTVNSVTISQGCC